MCVEATPENCQRVIDGLAQLDGAARELTFRDILDNAMVKVADEVEVDVSTHAGKVAYEEAVPGTKEAVIDGVRVPFLGLDALIASRMRSIG